MVSVIQSPDVLHVHPSVLQTEYFCEKQSTCSLRGTLTKWVSYIQGWQPHCFFLNNSSFSYYKTEHELIAGKCISTIQLKDLRLLPHRNDDQRFDIVCHDSRPQSMWYIRCSTAEECRVWMEAIYYRQANIECSRSSGAHEDTDRSSIGVHLSRHPSTNSRSADSNTSFTQMNRLKAQIEQMTTFKDNCDEPINALDDFFDKYGSYLVKIIKSQFSLSTKEIGQDALLSQKEETTGNLSQNGRYSFTNLCDKITADDCDLNQSKIPKHSSVVNSQPTERMILPFQDETQRRDIIGAAHSFKTNAEGYVNGVNHCVELIQQREKMWQARINRERERREEVENFLTAARTGYLWTNNKGLIRLCGPDQEEGPNCQMDEEEFYDAVEFQLDLLEKEDDIRHSIRNRICESEQSNRRKSKTLAKDDEEKEEETDPFFIELNEVIRKSVENHLGSLSLSDSNHNDMHHKEFKGKEFEESWLLLKKEGDLRVYESLLPEQPGMVITPLLATHSVKGVTAREMVERFWEPKHRLDWERAVDVPPYIVIMLDENTAVIYQIFKRVWPTSQRYSFFLSTRRRLAPNKWIAVNHSLDAEQEANLLKLFPEHFKTEEDGLVRAMFYVSMYCYNEVNSSHKSNRKNITCHVKYNASVNPGGYAPASVLKTVYRREYPRFVSTFVNYVADAVEKEELNSEDIA